MKRTWIAILVGMLLLSGLVGAVILSNTLNYGGDLKENPIEISYSNGDPGPTTLLSGQGKIFNFTVANTNNVQQVFVLSFSFSPSIVVTSMTADLTRIALVAGVYVPTTEILTWTDSSGTWLADSATHSLDPFAADFYELEMTVNFIGSGGYVIDISAIG